MKKFMLPILLFLMFIPFVVNAESKYLYDVLKNEAESGGLAKEYTGEHHDSFTQEPSHKIYHWYANNYTEGNLVLQKNNVIFGGFCWQIFRTTDTGGVKMIYNGIPSDGQCNSTGVHQQIGKSKFGYGYDSLAYSGYMTPKSNNIKYRKNERYSSESLFGNNVTYDKNRGEYTLINTSNKYDNYHHYTCNNSTGRCNSVRYYYFDLYYVELYGESNIEELISNMLNTDEVNYNNSPIKSMIDTWYETNMTNNVTKQEDIIFCNDRSIQEYNGWNPNGGDKYKNIVFNNNINTTSLKCKNETDQFSTYNTKAKLKYPVGMMTIGEANLLNNNTIRYTGQEYWILSNFFTGWVYGHSVSSNGVIEQKDTVDSQKGVRPVISLKKNIKYSSGSGSKTNPYIVADLNKSNILINNDTDKGIVENLNNTSNVEELLNVTFKIRPSKGYIVKSIQIIDSNRNEVEYESRNDNEYSFIMPDSDVTITPIYEKIKSSINIEIINETEDLNVEINDMTQVEYEEKVKFSVTPIKGYKVTNLKIVDEDNNEIEYETPDNKNYTFTMPESNVTIIPSYERVKNAVEVEDNKNTKEFIIEVNDSKAVVYEDTVKLTITPEDGYTIDKIIIKDSNDNEITFKKISNKNEYSFVMPDSDVVITPTYRKLESINVPDTLKNPNTGTGISIIIIFMLIISSITYIIFKKKKYYIMK